MENPSIYKAKFKELKCCVLIPTYNNERTVGKVLREVLQYTDDLIVVNDGATDSTAEILKGFPEIQLVTFEKNRGKGMALRKGFIYAADKGYDFAITLDSDGQHFPEDIPTLLRKLEEDKNILIIGARNMDQASVPGKSSFGNKVSSFWYFVETGIRLPDTQSGFRLYPVRQLRNMRFFTGKFEFEIEVIVRAAWKGINVIAAPVKVYYGADRVSHFRPGPDVLRIFWLNVLLVLISVFYIRPRNLILNMRKKSFWLKIKESIFNSKESNLQKSSAVAFGVFMGIVPIWGYQLLTGIPLAKILRLNMAIFIAAANISFPPMNILFMYLSYKAGSWLIGNASDTIEFSWNMNHEIFRQVLMQFLVGGSVLAFVSGATAGLITYLLLSVFRKKTPLIQQQVR